MAATSKKPFFSVSGIDISSDRGNSASDFITNVAVQTITGRLSKKLATNGVLYGSVDNGVTWIDITSRVSGTAITWNGASLLPGSNTILFKLADATGNFSALVGNRTYTLDTAAPEQTVSGLRLSADSGASASDFITKTRTQTISGTLSAKLAVGDALYGSVDNGATWTNITSKVSDTTITWKGAALKSGDNVILFKVVDVAGNTSTLIGNQAYTLDTSAPIKPTLALAVDSGSSGSDKLTNNGTVVVSGLETGARWQYTTDSGKSWTDGGGNSLTLAGDGRKTVQVRQTDLAGNTATSAQFTFTLDATGPTQTINNVDIGTDSGYSASDFITNAATQTITGTLSKRLAAGDVLYGSVDNGVTWSNITSKVNGTAIAWNAATLQEGNGTILLKVADAAGNNGVVARQTYTLDTAATVPTLTLANDTGASTTDGITNNGMIHVGGLETGATWQYSLDNGASWTTGSGSSFTVAGDGEKSSIVRQTDAAGNVSANSMALSFSLDTAATVPTLTLANDTGASTTDSITHNGTINVGGLEAGATWQYSLDHGATRSTGSGSSFTVAGDGEKSVQVHQTDAAGNTGSSGTRVITVDTVAPVFPSLATASVAENTASGTSVYHATVDGDSGVTYSLLGIDASLFTINAGTGAVGLAFAPDYENPRDAGVDNFYDFTVRATDVAGNAADQSVRLGVTDVVDAGQCVIDLGVQGKLIAPVQVEGKWYYAWDMNGDGVHGWGEDNTGQLGYDGAVENAAGSGYRYDYATHDVLDGIFTRDINGNVNPGSNTDDTYRYATLNGVHLVLPTVGETPLVTGSYRFRPGTAVADGATNNASYDDLLAIWDAHNGGGTGTNTSGVPSGWTSYHDNVHTPDYWSATFLRDDHVFVSLSMGYVSGGTFDGYGALVAVQVL